MVNVWGCGPSTGDLYRRDFPGSELDVMFAGEPVARPFVQLERGLLGRAEPSLMHGGRTMGKYSEAFVAFDVAKKTHAVAIAEGGRTGEVRFLGDVAPGRDNGRL